MTVLSVDLASRRYRDNGIALLDGVPGRITARLVNPQALGLDGEPQPQHFAQALLDLARRESVRLILLGGPQGWRANISPHLHQRSCERETLTPGKTGLPGVVKPATWTRMATFSVSLFDALHAQGWPRLTRSWSGAPAAIESFPTHAWRMLGRRPLPGKSPRSNVTEWRDALTQIGIRQLPAQPSHDEVQALVAGLAGIGMLTGGLDACDVRGVDPIVEGVSWREGLIVSPRL